MFTSRQKAFLQLFREYWNQPEPRDWSSPSAISKGTSSLLAWFKWVDDDDVDLARLRRVLHARRARDRPKLWEVQDDYSRATGTEQTVASTRTGRCPDCGNTGVVLVVTGRPEVGRREEILRDPVDWPILSVRGFPCHCACGTSFRDRVEPTVSDELRNRIYRHQMYHTKDPRAFFQACRDLRPQFPVRRTWSDAAHPQAAPPPADDEEPEEPF